MRLIHDICTEANPNVAMAFNRGKLPSAANDNPDYEDFTSVSLIDTSYALSRDIHVSHDMLLNLLIRVILR